MSQYVIKFSKQGYICYTSHLDLLRLFKRAFKRGGISLSYSQGFNPHPKMGFAQPLSLGYSSISEYLEFETDKEYELPMLRRVLEQQLPEGVEITACQKGDKGKKTLAARTCAAEYLMGIPLEEPLKDDGEVLCRQFLEQKAIKILKKQKKTKALKEVNIKDKIRQLTFTIAGENIFITALLDSGSESNLSPELLLSAILKFLDIHTERAKIGVMRTKLLFDKDK